MVAIVSGNTLGLELTSRGVLGDRGVNGDPAQGQGGEQVYVNAATGNLVLQQLQDELVGAGLDVNSVLTYNSQGLATDDNGDNFSLGAVPAQLALTGSVNTSGSTVTRTAFDGSRAIYAWNSTTGSYQCVNGSGAFDSIRYTTSTSKYTWTDGATQATETYDGVTGRLSTRSDANGNTLIFDYDNNGMLHDVTDANGEVVTYVYSGSQLTAIDAPVTDPTTDAVSTQQVVSYAYDSSNRLKSIAVDLSPAYGSTADGNVYVTSFTYDGASTRVATMQQTDGTELTFTYDSSHRIYTITDAQGNLTTFTYDTGNSKTSVWSNGQTTVYGYNAATGMLTSVVAPAVNGVTATTQYFYNANGQLTSMIDGDGCTTSYGYDAAGNQTSVLDAASNLTTRTYDAKNRLLTQATSIVTIVQPVLVGDANMTISGTSVTKTGSVSDWNGSVRSANGIVGAATVSFIAGSTANHVMVGLNSDPATDESYQSIDYALYLRTGTLQVWTNGTLFASIGSYVQGDKLSVSYDGSGHINISQNGQQIYSMTATVTQPLYVDSSFCEPGAGVSNILFGSGPATGDSSTNPTTRYVYSDDGKGNLRFLISPAGRVTEFGYDAAGAITSETEYPTNVYSSGSGIAVPTEAQMVTWRASQDLTNTKRTEYVRGADEQLLTTRVFGTVASNGSGVADATTVTTSTVYDKRGDLLTQQTGAAVTAFTVDGLGRITSKTQNVVGTTTTAYADASNRIIVNLANGLVRTETLDTLGRVISSVDALSGVTKASTTYAYDALGHLLRSTDATGVSTWSLYDADGRKDADIDATGAMTEYAYDSANQVTKATTYATLVNTALLVDGSGNPINPPIASIRPATTTSDHARWTIYDADGRILQVIDATGAVTQYAYDANGRLTCTTEFATIVPITSLGNSPAPVTVAPASGDRVTRNYYDVDGNLAATLDPAGYLTEYQYDAADQRTVTIRYATASSATAASTLTQVRPASSPTDARSVTIYDLQGRVAGEVDATGALTATYYNADGTVDHATTYAARVALPVAAGTSISSIAVATPGSDRTISYTYDADGRVQTQTDPVGTVTTYTYDAGTSNVVCTAVTGALTGGTTTQTTYSALGQVTATLSGVGSAAIAAGTLSTTAAWAQYGTHYTYDLAGRRTSMTDPLGNKTLYFYDADERLRFTVDPKSQVQELRYDAFGNVTTTLKYANSIDTTDLPSGGLVTGDLTSAVAAIADEGRDAKVRNVYDVVGRQTLSVDATGAAIQYTYDALGNVSQKREYAAVISGGHAMQVAYVAGSNSSAALLLGSFNAGDTITATVRFKATPAADGHAIGGRLYVGDGATGSGVYSPQTPATGGWQTLTVQYTVQSGGDPIYVYVYGNRDGAPEPGDSVQYQDLQVTSSQKGLVTEQFFDSIVQGSGVKQWTVSGSISQASTTLADVASDAQLQDLVNAIADPTRDRITHNIFDTDGRLVTTVSPANTITSYLYDAGGHVTQEHQYANQLKVVSDDPTGPAMQVNYVSGTNSSAAMRLGTFVAGDVITATVRFKATPAADGHAIGGRLYVGDDATGVGVYSPQTSATGSWQTLTVTYTVANSGDPIYLVVYGNRDGSPETGDYVLYDDLQVTSTAKGEVAQSSFDSIAQGSGVGQWTVSGSIAQVNPAPVNADPYTPSQLQAFMASMVDSAYDRITTNEYDAVGRLVYSSDAMGHASRMVYDTLGRVVYTIGADGSVTHTQYDADGRATKTVRFASRLSDATMSSLAHAPSVAQIDALQPAPSISDSVTQNRYDALGRLRFSMDGTRGITELRYDADGNLVDRITYVNPATWNADSDPTVVADVSRDRHVHSSYDAVGNLIAQSDGTGAVVVNTYDADGQLTDRVSYANRISAGSWSTSQLPNVTADATRDIHERFDYDALGQLAYSADGTGAVTAYTYDSVGNLTRKTLLATLATAGQALDTVATSAALDRTELFAYDTFGRRVWHADATGALTYTGYDADSNVIETIQYAQPFSGALPEGTAPLAITAGDRLTQYTYNAYDQVAYTVDALNRVSLNTYFQDGTLQSTTAYAATIAAGALPSTVVANYAADETTSYQYDAAGHLAQRTDAMGGVQSYSYDGVGNKVAMTDQKGQSWTWSFDAAGREVEQFSPLFDVTSNSVVNGDLNDTTVNVVASLTLLHYDGAGNLVQRIVMGQPNDRTTTYDYDASGRQISVTGSAFNSYDSSGHLVSSGASTNRTFYDAFGNVAATVDSMGHITYTTHDQANRLTFSVDQLGYITGVARDVFGEITAQTKYGAQTTLIGAAPTSAADVPTSAAVASAVTGLAHGDDRIASYTYDKLGRVTSQAGMSGYFLDATADFGSNATETSVTPTTTYQYDTFGDMVLSSQLVNQSQGLHASTYHYFDAVGQETDTIDAMGYQTYRSFDSFGNVAQTIEYATAKTGSWSVGNLGATPTSSSTDRTTSNVFDRLNRKTSESRNVDYSLTDDGTVSGHTLTTTWGYDAAGNLTRTTDPSGANTYREYNSLGRLRAVIGPARSSTVGGSMLTPVTEYAYDSFGDVTVVTQRATSATGVAEFTGVWTSNGANGYAVSASSSDRITRTQYDDAGHAIQVDDPMAATSSLHNTYNKYDAAGRLTYTYHDDAGNDGVQYTVYQGYQYDARGQLTSSIQSVGTASAPRQAVTGYRYNAFGEVTAKGVDDGWQEFFDYDTNGNLWLTNSGTGVVTAYAYDLQGHVTSQYTSQGAQHGDVDLSTAMSIQDVVAQSASLRVVNTVHDLVGDARRVDQASRSTVDAGVTVRVGTSGYSIHTEGSAKLVQLQFNSLVALGSGQVQFDVKYTNASGTALESVVVVDAADTFNLISPDSPYLLAAGATPGLSSIQSVVISKKDVDGNWHTVESLPSTATSLTQLEIDMPDDPRAVVTFTYTKSGGTPVTLRSPSTAGGAFTGLIGYGRVYSFDTSTLAAGTYTYSTTVTSADGSVSSPRVGTFTVGTVQIPSVVTTQITPSVFKTYDRWGNLLTATDSRSASWVTSYQYNANNQVVKQTQPAPLTGSAAPVTQYFYDRQGHEVATIDADSHLSGQLFDAAGQVTETDAHPDSATIVKTTNAYDAFGELVQSVAGNGYTATGAAVSNIADFTTQNTYDAMGDLLSVQDGTSSGGNVTDVMSAGLASVNERKAYTYDADGHRLSSWDDTNPTGTHLVTTYAYDAAGHLVSTTLPLITGQSTASRSTFAYDDNGHETAETDADGNTETWTYDYFGRVTAHKDLGTTTYGYTYDHAGQLIHQTSSGGQDLNYAFDAAGQLTSIFDGANGESTVYAYDAAGRHLQESTSFLGRYYQDNHLAYDNIGRLVDSSDGEIHVSFQYDAVGNRTFVGTHVIESGPLLSGTQPSATLDSSRYFTYDGMNRQLHVNWGSQTVAGQAGHTLTYDADGNRLSDVFTNNLVTAVGTVTSSGTGPDGTPLYTAISGTQNYSAANAQVTEVYSYDADDRLTQALYTIKAGSTAASAAMGWIKIDGRVYDSAGHVRLRGASLPGASSSQQGTTMLQWMNSINPVSGLVGLHLDTDRVISFTYDEDGQMTSEYAGNALSNYGVTYTYDAAGNNTGNTLTTFYREANQSGVTHSTTNAVTDTFKAAEGYERTVQSSVQSTSKDLGDGSNPITTVPTTVTTTTYYDVNSHASGVSGDTMLPYAYVEDAQGNVLRRSGTGAELRALVVNGESLGQYGPDGTVTNEGDVQKFNFTFGFQSMEDSSVQTGTTTTLASQGETLQEAAAAAYGDAALWQRIASANGLDANARLQRGQRLVIAGNGGELFNSGSTFAINDASLMLGETAPHTVTSEAPMTGVEQDNYYKDVYNREAPNYSGNKGVGESIGFIQATDSDLSDMAEQNASPENRRSPPFVGPLGSGRTNRDDPDPDHTAEMIARNGWYGGSGSTTGSDRNFGDRNTTSVGELSSGVDFAGDGSSASFGNVGGTAGTSAADAVGGAVNNGIPTRLYHYTNEAGMNGIVDSAQLNPSLKALNPNDVRYGNGQYLSDIPPGARTPSELSYDFLGMPFQARRFTNYVELDVTGLNVVQGRPGVFVVPNEVPLDLTGRIVSSGKVIQP